MMEGQKTSFAQRMRERAAASKKAATELALERARHPLVEFGAAPDFAGAACALIKLRAAVPYRPLKWGARFNPVSFSPAGFRECLPQYVMHWRVVRADGHPLKFRLFAALAEGAPAASAAGGAWGAREDPGLACGAPGAPGACDEWDGEDFPVARDGLASRRPAARSPKMVADLDRAAGQRKWARVGRDAPAIESGADGWMNADAFLTAVDALGDSRVDVRALNNVPESLAGQAVNLMSAGLIFVVSEKMSFDDSRREMVIEWRGVSEVCGGGGSKGVMFPCSRAGFDIARDLPESARDCSRIVNDRGSE